MAASREACRQFIFVFAHEHLEFRVPEILSIATFFGINLVIPKDYNNRCPFLLVNLENESCARNILSRSVTVKSLFEVWSCGCSYEDLFNQFLSLPPEFIHRCSDSARSYRIQVDCFNKQISLHERIARIERLLDNLTFQGKMDLSVASDDTFHILEYYGPQGSTAPTDPQHVYFGRWLCDGQREALNKYHLQNRHFISNTSMDPTLSMIMANMAKVSSGMLVCDPFVGSGSLLVACSHYGAYVMGTDIDYNLVVGIGKSSRAGQKWRAKDESIRSNLRQYGREHLFIDVLVADASRHALWRQPEYLDAIIADPPYGIREPTMKLGSSKEDPTVGDIYKEGHIPCKTNYSMSDIISDLLKFAAKFLVVGGRLVFWIPVFREDYKESQVPRHPYFRLVANSEQTLNKRVSRRLITLEKLRNYRVEDVEDQLATPSSSSVTPSSSSVDDHYSELSFRDRYFRPSSFSKNKKTDG